MLPPDDARGLVDPATGARHFDLHRFAAEDPLAGCIDRYWAAEWDLDEPFEQRVVAFPAVHLIFEGGDASLSTLWRDEFVRRLEGQGRVVAVMFRSAGFHPFLAGSELGVIEMGEISERRLDMAEVFGRPGEELAAEVGRADDDLRLAIRHIHRFFSARLPSDIAKSQMLSDVVELIQADPSLGKVGDLAARLGTSPRQVQRLFARYVGATPKFVIQRSRVQLAAEAARSPDPDWARLAAELGYSDQSHLTRSFTQEIGTSPAAYRARLGT